LVGATTAVKAAADALTAARTALLTAAG